MTNYTLILNHKELAILKAAFAYWIDGYDIPEQEENDIEAVATTLAAADQVSADRQAFILALNLTYGQLDSILPKDEAAEKIIERAKRIIDGETL